MWMAGALVCEWGRASGLQKTELWGGGKVISGRFRDLAMSVQ